MFNWFRKERRDIILLRVTRVMTNRLREEILKGNNHKPITVTFSPEDYGYLVGYLSTRTGVEL